MRAVKCQCCRNECAVSDTGREAQNDRLMPCGRPEGCMWLYAVTSRAKRIILREIETVASLFDTGADENSNLADAHRLIRDGAEKLNAQALEWLVRVNERMREIRESGVKE